MEVLDNICAVLDIEIETYQVGNLLNNFVKADSQIKSINWSKDDHGDEFTIFNDDDLEPLSQLLLQKICIKDENLTLTSYISGHEKSFTSSGGFTIQNMMNSILEFEREARSKTDWFGGIDAHHIYFEGISKVGPNKYSIHWGS
jgi:hypothetical protein